MKAGIDNRVFGDPELAERWLGTKHQLLDQEPIKMLTSDEGAQKVLDELTRIQWGDWA